MFAFLETPADLRPWVQCIWTHPSGASAGPAPPIAPDGCCEWIVHLAHLSLVLRAGTWRRQPRTYLFGHKLGYADQAYLTRLLKALAGRRPGEVLGSACLICSRSERELVADNGDWAYPGPTGGSAA